jgi:hypothetical protein
MLLLIPPPLPPHPSFILHSSATLPPSLGTPAAFSLPKDKHTFLLWCAPVRPNALNGFLLQVGIQNGNVKCVCSGFDVTTPGNSTTTWKQVCVKRLERLFEKLNFCKAGKIIRRFTCWHPLTPQTPAVVLFSTRCVHQTVRNCR